ncbi:DDE-type integrase/transposase/recombinase [Paenibacillus sp. UNC496MF]|uniref:DDE-type integrase/transposase/recombinase n=1 Tax=Paenibacillus sp. UNC496MF TaxID=1502753 RepID=UPI000B2C9EC1|nr:DDE-type integrase/transposase/recombinase [Paenibacillus sp. UNC496MF]
MSQRKYSALEKLAILQEVSHGEIGFLAAAKKYGINKTTLMRWQRRHKSCGDEGLERRTRLRSYSAELKLRAVKDYLEGELSQYQIIEKYKIASTRQLFNWVNIVSYVLGRSNNNPLVFQTLRQALQAAPRSSPMLHSDRGYQYTSLGFKKLLDENNMIQSMSRVGRCI